MHNRFFVIKDGQYRIDNHACNSHKLAYLVYPVVGHYGILFHSANHATQLKGCFAPCMRIDGASALFSVMAMEKLKEITRGCSSMFLVFRGDPLGVRI